MRTFAATAWCVCLLLFAGARIADAQESSAFSGRVVDRASSAPVRGATVLINGFPGTARTDADGRFRLEARPEPPFQIIVVLPTGHVARPIDIKSIDGEVTTVAVDPVTDESVTVVGAAPSVTASPASGMSLLSAEQIRSRNPENLMQALETVPGVNAVSEGHATVPAIRGLARGRTLVLIDGARVTSERRVGPSATFADPSTFEGVDVARGPGSVAYGSDAIGGVISVRTRRAEPGSPLKVRGGVTQGVGIPETRGLFEVSKGFRRGGILVEAHARDADDWDSPADDSSILNSGWQDRGFLIRADHELGPGVLSAIWQSDFGRDIERPRNNSRAVRFYYPYENSHRLTSSYEVAGVGGFQRLVFTGFLGTFEQRTDQDRFATATAGRSIERADISARDFHVKGSGTRGVGRARLELGIDLNGRLGLEAIDTIETYNLTGDVTDRIDNLSVDSARRVDAGAFAQIDSPIVDGLRAAAGARVDRVTTSNVGGFFGDRDTGHSALSGFASLTAGPFSGFSLTGQVARGFRDPTLSDRYFRGPTGRGFITGNPDLHPETSLQFDVAARYSVQRSQLAVYGYRYRITDLVERYSTAPDFFFFRNQGRAVVRGFEVEARTEIGTTLHLEGGVNIARGEAGPDSHLDDIAPHTFFVMARHNFSNALYAQVRASYLAEDDRPGPSEIAAPSATVVDLSGGWKFTRHLELRGIVRNLLDDEYYASPDPRWVWAPGRSGSLTLALQF